MSNSEPEDIVFTMVLEDYKMSCVIPARELPFGKLKDIDIDDYINTIKEKISDKLRGCAVTMKVDQEIL